MEPGVFNDAVNKDPLLDLRVFVISLKRSENRRQVIAKKMHDAGLDYEIFEGEDGTLMDARLLKDIQQNAKDYRRKYGRDILAGEVGAALSHLNLYKKIVAENIELALILEDDIDFDDNLVKLIKNIREVKKSLEKYELILLGYSTSDLNYRKRAVCSYWGRSSGAGVVNFGRPVIWYWAAIAYLIKPAAAAKLLAQGEYPKMQADYLTANSPAYGVNLAVSRVPLVWPGEMNKESTIGDRSFEYSRNNLSQENKDPSIVLSHIKRLVVLKKPYYFLKVQWDKISQRLSIFGAKLSFENYRYVKKENI